MNGIVWPVGNHEDSCMPDSLRPPQLSDENFMVCGRRPAPDIPHQWMKTWPRLSPQEKEDLIRHVSENTDKVVFNMHSRALVEDLGSAYAHLVGDARGVARG